VNTVVDRRANKPGTYHHGDLRAALLDSVVGIIREQGLDAVTMRSVARQAGVSEASPYHHFENKADLLAGAAIVAYQELGTAIATALEAAESADQDPGVALAACMVRFGLERPGEYALMFGRHIVDLALERRADVRAVGGPAKSLARSAVTRSLERRDSAVAVDEAFPMVWACVHGMTSLVQERELGPDITVDEAVALASRAVAALLDGLA
jgi:AcrR family transcriptional regulator